MPLKKFFDSFAFLAIVAIVAVFTATAFGGTVRIKSNDGLTTVATLAVANSVAVTDLFLPATTTASGTSWSYYAGSSWSKAVTYIDTATGIMIFDPKGIGVTGLQYNWGNATITSGSTGPFVYASGTGAASNGTLFPQATYAATPTTWAARFAAAALAGNYATSGSASASTGGNWDLPWSFGAVAPTVNTASLVYSSTPGQGFRAPNLGGDLIGSGTGVGMFYYSQSTGGGNQYSPVIPVTSVAAVPEPSTIVLAGLGAAAVACGQLRRRKKHQAASTAAA